MLVMHGGLGQATKPPLAGLGCVWLGKDKGAVQDQQEQARAIQEKRKEERSLKLEHMMARMVGEKSGLHDDEP